MSLGFFDLVSRGGRPAPGALAGSIGIALVTTLLGLAIAIPSLSVYAVMRHRIDTLSSETMVASQDLISNFRPGGKKSV
jgi:biopolymer transport protein ExbB